MRRLHFLAASLTLALVACGPGGEGASTLPQVSTTSDDPAGTSSMPESSDTTRPDAESTTSVAESPGTTSGRPLAPDFTLELGDGGEYSLSEGEKPVYLVFWAEW